MKKFINEISKNINLEVNLPVYADYLMELYNRRAIVEFAMDYYTYQGMIADSVVKDEYLHDFTKEFNDIIREYVVDICVNEKREEAIKKIDTLRNSVYNVVEVLAAYADIFARYEYVVNRCEYLFKEADVPWKYTDEDFTRQIMQYIFSDEDNSVINTKICEIISELPLRLTKNKFFELLSEGMSVYSKTDRETIDDFIYSIRSSSMLALPDRMEYYRDLAEIYNEVRSVDYASISEATFNEIYKKLEFAADFIEKETNIFMMLQGLINKAYVLIIAAPYVDNSAKETDNARDIVENINRNFDNEDYITLEEDITDKFIFMEGTPEELQNIIQSVEYVLDSIRNDHISTVKSIMADKLYQGLFVCEKLLADSLFIDLSPEYCLFDENSYVNEKTDASMDENEMEFNIEKYLNTKRDELISELINFFKTNQKLVNRSVMSLIISRLPVFFNNITEVQDYIYRSLSNCTNKAEKLASIEIIRSFMEDSIMN